MSNKLVNVLMWIPLVGILIGLYELILFLYAVFAKGLLVDCWFLRAHYLKGVLNGLYQGAWLSGLFLLLFL